MNFARSAGMVILVGLTYAVVGVVFAWPGTHVQGWRLAAWLVCGAAFAAHIAYEGLRLRNAPARAAWHVALAVALGAFGLAAAANIHSLSVDSTAHQRRLLRISLAIWPVITGLPAFLVALGAGAVLARLPSRRPVQPRP